jgi:NHLM bacteriocin system ABC transporter ATP-binding protein
MEVLYRLKANERLLLDDQELVWVVKSGSLSLFATKVKDEMPVGDRRKEAAANEQRRYLFNVGALEALFGAATNNPESLSLVAVAIEATELSQISIADLAASSVPSGETGAILLRRRYANALLQRWINHLSETFSTLSTAVHFSHYLSLIKSENATSLPSILADLLNGVLMFVYSWQLALVGVGIALVTTIVTTVASLLVIRKLRRQQELEGEINGLTVQLINGVAKLRVAMAEEWAFAAWAEQYSKRSRLKASFQLIRDNVSVFNEVLSLVTSALLFWFAAESMQKAQGSGLTVGKFLAFNAALGIFIGGVSDLSNTLTDILAIVPLWERAKPILQAQPEYDPSKANPSDLMGRVALDGVTFRYRDDGLPILNDISLHVEPGEFVAIVGPSGSGKSTILRLLLGFETPLSGTVYYDRFDLASLDLQAVRRQLGVVLQNGRIGTGSIFENITAGALVSHEQALSAARMAGFADDIELLPMGMHTVISEGGTNLSGGQRQRLLIARALVNQPKIILMDEATSSLDNRTQAIVSESLEQLNATRIVIAHRLSTIRNADRIYVIEAGRVVQVGTFSELVNTQGLFAQLVARQME